jgi:hypothetical protein
MGFGAHETRFIENGFFARKFPEITLIVDGPPSKTRVFDSGVAFATKCSAGVAFDSE